MLIPLQYRRNTFHPCKWAVTKKSPLSVTEPCASKNAFSASSYKAQGFSAQVSGTGCSGLVTRKYRNVSARQRFLIQTWIFTWPIGAIMIHTTLVLQMLYGSGFFPNVEVNAKSSVWCKSWKLPSACGKAARVKSAKAALQSPFPAWLGCK